MSRLKQLYIFCEGQTEQGFCALVLQPHLFPSGEGQIHTLAVGQKDNRHVYGMGSRNKYMSVRKFILNTIKQRAATNVYFSTLIDLYALPNDFPGKDTNVRNPADPASYVLKLEEEFLKDIDYYRFVPYLQLHEYETILFADPQAFQNEFEHCTDAIQELNEIVSSFPTIEHINDGRETAPSKRIIKLIPQYDGRKASAGPAIAARIGLPRIRQKCPHFHAWLTRLESIDWDQS
jgi:hypothetical protein